MGRGWCSQTLKLLGPGGAALINPDWPLLLGTGGLWAGEGVVPWLGMCTF